MHFFPLIFSCVLKSRKTCFFPLNHWQLISIESVMQNITEKIKQSWGNLADRATKLVGSLTGGPSSRKKRLAELLIR